MDRNRISMLYNLLIDMIVTNINVICDRI